MITCKKCKYWDEIKQHQKDYGYCYSGNVKNSTSDYKTQTDVLIIDSVKATVVTGCDYGCVNGAER